MGQVKISLSLLMKSLCTGPHTCTVSITTVKQDGKSRQHRQTHVKQLQQLLLYITNVSEMHQIWTSVLRLNIYLYEDYFKKFYLIHCKTIYAFMYLCMNGLQCSFPSRLTCFFAYKYFCCSQAQFGLKFCSCAFCLFHSLQVDNNSSAALYWFNY